MGMLAAWRPLSNSTASLPYLVQHCVTTQGPQGLCWRDFPYCLLFSFPGIPQLSLGLWHYLEGDLCFAWHLILEQMSACAVAYGSCGGDISWEAGMSCPSSVCLLLGKGMGLVI